MPLHMVLLVSLYIKTLKRYPAVCLQSCCCGLAVAGDCDAPKTWPCAMCSMAQGQDTRDSLLQPAEVCWPHLLACLTWLCSFSNRQQWGQMPYTMPEDNRETA